MIVKPYAYAMELVWALDVFKWYSRSSSSSQWSSNSKKTKKR